MAKYTIKLRKEEVSELKAAVNKGLDNSAGTERRICGAPGIGIGCL
jgi:hypothetical protein